MSKYAWSSVALALLLILCLSVFSSIPAQAASTGRISGQLLDGSNHSAPLAGQQVTLQMAKGNTTRDLAIATTDAQGNFSFNNLSTDKTISYAVYMRYQGAQYVSGLVTLNSNPAPHVNLTVYQATQRSNNIAIVDASVLIHEPNVQKGTLTISEVFAFMNLDTQAYVGSLKATNGPPNALLFSLPPDTRNIVLGEGFSGYHVIQVDRGFASDAAILPGQNTFSFSFDVPYSSSTLDLNYTTMYPTVSLAFLVLPAIHAESQQLSSQGVVSDQQQHLYNRFVANMLPANKPIQLHLAGLAVNAPLNNWIILLIIAVLLMGSILLVTWLLLRAKQHQSVTQLRNGRKQDNQQNTRNSANHTSDEQKKRSSAQSDRKQKLLEELLALDQAHEVGILDEAIYQERRGKVKARLRSLIEIEH
jgi:5-hydroxyisourate hydrolase-like protein (transthyretin family)